MKIEYHQYQLQLKDTFRISHAWRDVQPSLVVSVSFARRPYAPYRHFTQVYTDTSDGRDLTGHMVGTYGLSFLFSFGSLFFFFFSFFPVLFFFFLLLLGSML